MRIEGDYVKVAIFDFDGTIYKYETYSLMIAYVKEHPVHKERYKSFYYSIVPPYVGYKMKVYPEEKMKASLTQKFLNIFHGKTIGETERFFQELAGKMTDDFHPLVLEKMYEHHERNDLIMVVSGAFTPLLKAALKELPVDYIIGTEIPTNNNYVDATTPIDHVQSERKSELILETLKDKVVDWKNSYAYGDSSADLPVLEMVGNPIAVCPEVKLQMLANNHDWTVLC